MRTSKLEAIGIVSLFAVVVVGLFVCTLPAATNDLRESNTTAGAFSGRTTGGTFRMSKTVNFATDKTTSGDYDIIMTVPANSVVREVYTVVDRAEGGTATCDVYFKDTSKVSNLDLNSTAGLTLKQTASSAFVVTELTTVSLHLDHTVDYAICRVIIAGERLPEAD